MRNDELGCAGMRTLAGTGEQPVLIGDDHGVAARSGMSLATVAGASGAFVNADAAGQLGWPKCGVCLSQAGWPVLLGLASSPANPGVPWS
jgi:hypothetical protein